MSDLITNQRHHSEILELDLLHKIIQINKRVSNTLKITIGSFFILAFKCDLRLNQILFELLVLYLPILRNSKLYYIRIKLLNSDNSIGYS